MTETVTEPTVEPPVDSIYRGGVGQAEQTPRTAKDLIETEWKIIDKLQKLATKARSDKSKGFYYQTLAGHIRTLATLLKLHGQTNQTTDIAKLLSEINSEAKKLAKRLKQK